MNIPAEFALSKAMVYIVQKSWQWRKADSERVELESCPLCKSPGWTHFYIKATPGKGDGLYICHKCGVSGHLNDLKERLGDKIEWVSDTGPKGDAEAMPDVVKMHEDLLADLDVMDYLTNERGFSTEIIKEMRLGVSKRYYKKLGAEVKSLAYPYLNNGNCVFIHWRTLPPADKEFSSLKGWDAPLFNAQVLKEGVPDIVFVEGEANVISALQHGIKNICGVPGANFKKAMWIEQLDKFEDLKIYLAYDKDKVGQKAAQTLASRIGINRCYKLVLPDFDIPTDDGVKKGKDLNEWFMHGGGTLEKWEALKASSLKFDVDGVVGIDEGLDNFENELNNKPGMMPKYTFPWPSLGKLVGLEEGDMLFVIGPEKQGKTTFAMNLMEHFVNDYGEDGIVICLEMSNERMLRKWVSHVAQVKDFITFDPVEAATLKDDFLKGVVTARAKHQGRQGNLYFCCPKGVTSNDDLYKLIVDCIRRYGVSWIMFDNIHTLAGHTLKSDNRMIHLDKISKNLVAITKEYGKQMIVLLQPHRIRDGALCTTDDADGSASLMKDCDAAIVLNRTKNSEMSVESLKTVGVAANSDASFSRKMLCTVGLSRYSSGGECVLDFDGATSTVREYNEAAIMAESAYTKANIMEGIEDGQNNGSGSEGLPSAHNI